MLFCICKKRTWNVHIRNLICLQNFPSGALVKQTTGKFLSKCSSHLANLLREQRNSISYFPPSIAIINTNPPWRCYCRSGPSFDPFVGWRGGNHRSVKRKTLFWPEIRCGGIATFGFPGSTSRTSHERDNGILLAVWNSPVDSTICKLWNHAKNVSIPNFSLN